MDIALMEMEVYFTPVETAELQLMNRLRWASLIKEQQKAKAAELKECPINDRTVPDNHVNAKLFSAPDVYFLTPS